MKGHGWRFEKEVEKEKKKKKDGAWGTRNIAEWDRGSSLEIQLQEQTPQCYLHTALSIYTKENTNITPQCMPVEDVVPSLLCTCRCEL